MLYFRSDKLGYDREAYAAGVNGVALEENWVCKFADVKFRLKQYSAEVSEAWASASPFFRSF